MLKKLNYLLEALGFKKLFIYLLLRPFRKLLLQKDTLLYTYREISYAKSIYESIKHNKIKKDKRFSRKIDDYYLTYGKKINKNWHYCYAHTSGIISEKYIPDINYTDEIEPYLNRLEFAEAYDDKNMYDKMFDNILMPECLIRCMNGLYFDKEYQIFEDHKDAFNILNKNVEFIIKPSVNSQGGRGIYKLTYDGEQVFLDSKGYQISELSKLYRKDFIIQKFLKQHHDLDKIYPYSINTLRVITLRFKGEIVTLSNVIRFGSGGAYRDNTSTGGLFCGITSEGVLNKVAMGKKLEIYEKHPYSNVRFEGVVVPGFDKVKKLTATLHRQLYYFDIISWDIAINVFGNPVLIEMNLRDQGIISQASSGPLFGDYTDEILKKVYLDK